MEIRWKITLSNSPLNSWCDTMLIFHAQQGASSLPYRWNIFSGWRNEFESFLAVNILCQTTYAEKPHTRDSAKRILNFPCKNWKRCFLVYFYFDTLKLVTWKSTWLVFFHFSSDLFCAPGIFINEEIKEEGSSIVPAAAGVLSWKKKILSRPFLTQIHPQLCQLLTA